VLCGQTLGKKRIGNIAEIDPSALRLNAEQDQNRQNY